MPSRNPIELRRIASLRDERLGVEVQHAGAEARLRLQGEVDLVTAPLLRQALELAEPGAERVVVDLRAVTFLDSSGLAVLAAGNQRARRRHARFVVVRSDGTPIAQALNLSALDRAIETTDEIPVGG